jgi:zinc and cadmium transporter
MPLLAWIVAATLVGGVMSVLAAAALALRARPTQVSRLISFAIGTMLGAALLEILPSALELSSSPASVTGTVLIGVLLFFLLEKLMLWRHHHGAEPGTDEPHDEHDHGRIATMVIVGDTFHNCVDGVIIAGAFLVSVQLGLISAVAIIAHEVPQELGDFLVLLHSGYSKAQAFAFNILSSGAMVVGGLLAYYGLQTVRQGIPVLLAIAAASMLYVSVADLLPGLVRKRELRATVEQVLLIAAGVATVWGIGEFAHSFIEA